MPHHPLLYAGDTSLHTAASYLAGMIAHSRLTFDYLPSDQPFSENLLETPRNLFIFSDYPAKLISPALQQKIVSAVHDGSGFIMIGGWESFCGCGGDWANSPLSQILPVDIAISDDRVNCSQPALITRASPHTILENLPWSDHPPVIGGYNRVTPKPSSQTLLNVIRFAVRRLPDTPDRFDFTPVGIDPLLVVTSHGSGRVAALMCDLAPHWVGGFVDWGDSRVSAQAPQAESVEVGSDYARFISQLLNWTGRFS